MREQIVTFTGLDTEASPTARPAGSLQVDQNLQHDQQGVLRVRRGCVKASGQTALSLAVRAVGGFDPGNKSFVEVRASGLGASAGVVASGASTLYSAVSQNKRPRIAVHNRKVYVVDGWRPMQRWDGLAAATVAAGITGPSQVPGAWGPTPTTASGNCTTGTHKFRYRYLDSTTGYVSEPSNEYQTSVVAGVSNQLTFAIDTSGSGNIIRSGDSKVDKIVVEMTLTGGATFYKAAEVLQTASTVVVSIADTSLVNQSLPWPGTLSSHIGVHLPPPTMKGVLSFRGRLWLYGSPVHAEGTLAVTNASSTLTGTGTDWTDVIAKPTAASFANRQVWRLKVAGDAVDYEINTRASATSAALTATYAGSTASGLAYSIYTRDNNIYYSEPGFPEAFPALNYIEGPSSGPITSLTPHASALLMTSLNGMARFVWSDSPATDGVRRTVPTDRGAVCPDVVVNVEETVYGLDRRGVWAFRGESPVAVSREIESLVQRINFAVEEKFTAVWCPKLRAVRWWVALDLDTEPHHFLQFDVDRQVWSTGQRDFAITAGGLVPTTTGLKVLVGDENGYDWYDDEGTTDGCDGAAAAQGLVRGSPTTTSVPLSVVLPTSPSLAGAYAYSEALGESRRITSNTSSTLTVAAFSSAPPVDTRIHLGRVRAVAKTKAFQSRGHKHVGRYMFLYFVPLAEVAGVLRRVRLRFYRNLASTQEPFEGGRLPSLGGLTFEAGGDWIVDVTHPDGVVKVSLGSEGVHYTEAELDVTDASVPVKILGVTIDGVDLEQLT